MSNKTRAKWNLLQFIEGEENILCRRLILGRFCSMLTLIHAILGLRSESERSLGDPNRKSFKTGNWFHLETWKTRNSTFLPFEKRFSISDGISHLSLHSHTRTLTRENVMTSAKIMSYHFHQKQYRRRVSPMRSECSLRKKTPTSWCSSMEKRKKKSEWGKIFNRASSWGEMPR